MIPLNKASCEDRAKDGDEEEARDDKLRGLFSISKNFQTARFRTLEELQTWDRVRKLPFEILASKPVPMLRFERNLIWK